MRVGAGENVAPTWSSRTSRRTDEKLTEAQLRDLEVDSAREA